MASLKRVALEVGFRAGLFHLVQRALRRREAVVLTFHRFSGNGEGHARGMPIQRFTEYMKYLTRHYRVVSLRTVTEELGRGVVRPYTVALTVDDGYHEVFTLAAPVMRRYGVPASVFVISDFTDGRGWPWTDRFGFVFDQAPRDRLAFTHRRAVHVLELQADADRRRAEAHWLEYAKALPVGERDELLDAIAAAGGVEIPVAPPREYRPMTWSELRALAAEGFDVGAHTRTHPILSRVGPEQLRAEIEGCREQMEQRLGFPVLHFAYPNGRREDYTPEAVELVARAGYRAAVTCVAGGNTPSTSLFELRRVGAAVEGLARFAQSVSGLEEVRLGARAWPGVDRMARHVRSSGRCAPATVDHRASRPRLALVAASLDILGGQGVQARLLADALRNDGYEILFVPINPRFPPGLRWLRRRAYARTLLNEALYVPSLLRLRRVDVVQVFSASYWSFVLAAVPAILAARSLAKRVVLHYHSGEADDHLARWGTLVHPWLRLTDEIVVPSEYLRGVFARHGYRARVIRNVVDTSCFRYRERAPLRPRLLSTRNLEPYYRVDNTLEAFALLRAQYPEATLTVAGYGREEGRLRRLAASLGAAGVRFVGRVEPRAMPDLCDQADVFVNSSVVDNQPVSVLEAFAAGLPAVSTGAGDIAAMVRDGETGLLVPPGDPAAMAKAVTSLLENPDRALLIARRARQEVEKYTWPRVRDAWAAVYAC